MVPTLLRLVKRLVAETSRLQRINIGPRLSLCFLLIILAMLAGNGVLLWQFHQARAQAERLRGVDQELIAVLQSHVSLMSFYEKLEALTHSENTGDLLNQAQTIRNALLENSRRTRDALSQLPPEVKLDPALLPTLLTIQDTLPAELEGITALARSRDWEAVRLRLTIQLRPLEFRSAELVESIDRQVAEERVQAVLNIARVQRKILFIVPITALLTLLFAALLGLAVTRSITQPLGRLMQGSRALAKGDFSHRVPAVGKDEIGRLGKVFNDMIVRLQELYRELQRKESYLAEAQLLSHTGSFGWEVSSGRIQWSLETFRIFEYPPGSEPTIEAVMERTHPEDRSSVQQFVERVSHEREEFDFEHRLLMPDGAVKYLRVVGHPFTNDSEFLGAVTDITEQKRAQQALAASERKLAAIVNAIPTAAWTTRPDGSADFLNQVWLDYTGITAEKAQGWGWAEAIHSDDRTKLVEEWQLCLASGTPIDTEARIRRFDGSYRWFLIRANPLRHESGNILKWYGTCVDIEDRKRREEDLHARELSWRQIVDNIPGLVATTGAMGEVEFLNRQTLEYFGKTNEELKNWALIGAVHPDDLPRVIEARKKSIEAGQIYEIEHRCRRGDGVFRWFQVRGLPVRDTENKITAWYLLLTDIDDRKKAEEALESSERNLSLMISAIPTYIHVLRTDGSVQYANQAVLDYAGLTLEDVRKEDYRARFFHPEDVERLREDRREALTRGVPFENEQRVLGKDGRYRWFLIRYNPLFDKQRRIDRWYVAATDIEDRKRAEAQVQQAYLRLAEAQRLSKTGSFITDLLADEHNFSEETFRIFELDPATKITLQMVRDTIHPEDQPTFDAVIARAMTGAEFEFGFRIVTSRGAVKHLRGVTRVLGQSAGHPVFIGALQDVTESKLAEEALNRARTELAHVTRVTTLNALTASIAHEVNQPLSGIVSNASASLRFLSGDAPNLEEAREAIRDIVRDGKRAGEIITRIRALTKKTATRREKLDLNETISEVLALIGDEARRHGVIVRTQFADTLSPVAGDRVQLQQVVLNLVMNAIEAMSGVSDRPRQLVITTQNIDADCVQATVEDTGIGIAANTVDKIFDSFYTTKPGGMGMGLSISRSILQSHGGRLWAVGKDAAGTMFHFSVPKYHEEGAHAPATGT